MKAEKGKLVEFASGEKFIVVETLEVEGNVYHCLVAEDNSYTVFCAERANEQGVLEYFPVIEDEEVAILTEKFKPLLETE